MQLSSHQLTDARLDFFNHPSNFIIKLRNLGIFSRENVPNYL